MQCTARQWRRGSFAAHSGFCPHFSVAFEGPTGALAAADGKKQKQNNNRANLFWHFFHFIVRLAGPTEAEAAPTGIGIRD